MSTEPTTPPNLEDVSGVAPGTAQAEAPAAGEARQSGKSIVREYAEAIVVAMLLAFAIRVFVVQAFKIPSGSMIPTLLIGDHILVSKLSYGLQWPTDCKLQWNFPPGKSVV